MRLSIVRGLWGGLGLFSAMIAAARSSRADELPGADAPANAKASDAALATAVIAADCRLSVGADSGQPLQLLLDGRVVGTLPWSGEVGVGQHVLTTQSRSFASFPQHINCSSGGVLATTLETRSLPGQLVLEVEPDVEVFVDYHRLGMGSQRLELPSGRHRVELLNPHFLPWNRDIGLGAGEALTLTPRDFTPERARSADRDDLPASRRFRGLYGRLGIAVVLSTTRATDAVTRDCPAEQGGGQCNPMGPLGGNLLASVGYGHGWLGLEVFGGLMGQVSNVDSNYRDATAPAPTSFYGLAREENHTFARYGFVLGAGVRGTTPTNGLRGTAGLGFGLARQRTRYVRASESVTVLPAYGGSPERRLPDAAMRDRDLGTGTSPCGLADLGILVGGSPGTKLELSLVVLVQWPSAPAVPADRSRLGYATTFDAGAGAYPKAPTGSPEFESAQGVEWFIGPRLGLQFGY